MRRAIGMGGDKLMSAVSGICESSPAGREIASRRAPIFREHVLPHLIAEVSDLIGPDDLLMHYDASMLARLRSH